MISVTVQEKGRLLVKPEIPRIDEFPGHLCVLALSECRKVLDIY